MELHAQIACAMPRELARKGITWQDRAVYTEAIYYGRENLTDGIIARADLGFWMPDMPVKERVRRLNALRDREALEHHEQGWKFPDHVWRKWGKLRAEVEEKRAAEAERLRKHRERKRLETQAYEERTNVRDADETRAYETPKPKPYPKPEPEPKPEPSSSSPPTSSAELSTGSDDDDRFTTTLEHIVTAKTRDRHPHNPRAYAMTVRTNTIAEDGELIRRMLTDGDTPETVAAFVLGYGMSTETERTATPWCNPDCTCDGTGWVWVDDNVGGYTACPNRKADTA